MKRNHDEHKVQGDSMHQAIPLLYTKEQYERALERAKQHPDRSQDPNSITRGHGLITGCLGEIIVEDYLEHISETDDDERDINNKLQYDILLKDGTKLEVKSKGHSVLSCPNFYDCSVSALCKQKPDYYVFVRIHGRKLRETYGFDHQHTRKAWICGMIPREDMITQERLVKRGSVVRNSSHYNFTAKSNCYNIKIRELAPLRTNFGKKIDLCRALTLTFRDCKFEDFIYIDEDEYFAVQDGDSLICGYYEGLSNLCTEDRKHFEENVETYLFYHSMETDVSALQKRKEQGDWEIQRFKRMT